MVGPIATSSSTTNSKEWTCCFGIHVQTATVIIGIWHMILNVLALCLLMIIWSHPRPDTFDESYNGVDFTAPALPTPLSKVDNKYQYRDHTLNYDNFDMGGLVCICMIAITLMMIYGAIKGKPSHLLPFFCLQLFDFVITTLTATGYLCYFTAMPKLIADSHRLPWREKLLELSPNALIAVVLITFAALVFLKSYSIGIIWRCYRYLTIRQYDTMLPYIIPYVPTNRERDLSSLLPNYEDVIQQNFKQSPPPTYQVAMSNIDGDFLKPPSYSNLEMAASAAEEPVTSIESNAQQGASEENVMLNNNGNASKNESSA